MNFDLVIYHGGCPDGFSGAWVFKHNNCHVDTYGSKHGVKHIDITDKRVAIVDFSYPREETIEMSKEASYLVVLDHHQSAKDELSGLDLGDKGEIIFDMNRSGAQIAWDYLYPNVSRPWFIDYVADRDLWQKRLHKTDEISIAMWFDGYFNDFQKLENLFYTVPLLEFDQPGSSSMAIVEKGELLIESKNIEVETYSKRAVLATLKTPIGNFKIRITACPRQYRSDVGNVITKLFDDSDCSGIYWYDHYVREWWISLRCGDNHTLNLSDVTRSLPNGGGHPKAAGFTIRLDEGYKFEDFIVLENHSTNPITLEELLETKLPEYSVFLDNEIEGYLKSFKENNFKINGHWYNPVQLSCIPLHYHNILIPKIKEKFPDVLSVIYWYELSDQKWYLRLIYPTTPGKIDIEKLKNDLEKEFTPVGDFFEFNGKSLEFIVPKTPIPSN